MLKPLGAGIAGPLHSTPGTGLTQQLQEHPGLALPGSQTKTAPRGTSPLSLLLLQDLPHPFSPLPVQPREH